MEIDRNAKIVWDYMQMNLPLKKADAIFVLCSHDIRVAEYALNLFNDGFAPYIITSGGVGKLTEHLFDKPEAEVFKDVLVRGGVPDGKIIVESRSTNTGENILFTYKMLQSMGILFKSFIVVHKPYMERRTYATFKKQWPDRKAEISITSPRISYEEYTLSGLLDKDEIINVMVGDLQRIAEYPKMGFQIKQEIPSKVWRAYEVLVNAGYSSYLLST